ncbi:hypothetical protein [Virgibacillus salinus]|uniref:Copper resistance protein D n=1 Tax=Virgibacillus salinus TaxID=553311 RepID=A0A1H0ZG88_9BACI|nr:hypothetical protein [Virgibacillus salinus]SDQ26525.1 hypothetical protein SAMN05216231_1219 [Virgibacillus salinus]
MPWEVRQIILGIHIFLAINWIGGVMFIGWGVFPSVRNMAFAQQRKFFLALIQWSHRFLTAAGTGVILTGIVLGTIGGPIKNLDDIWHTSYGNIWLTALLIALITLLWGVFIGYRQSIKVFSDVALWETADSGDKKPLSNALRITILLESVEVSGFIALIICMVLL